MTYNRIATPRAYMDRLSNDLATGFRTISNYTIIQNDGSTAVTFDGGQLEDLFDMRPSNFATIAHDTQAFYIIIDTGMTSDTVAEANFLAILGHNFEEADASFAVQHDDASDFGSATFVSNSPTRVINAAVSSSANYVEPDNNGWSLITWANNNTDNRYYRIIISKEGNLSANFDSDVKIGSIMLGEYIDFPHSPDLSVGFDIDYDGTNLVTSAGGSTFANTSYLGAPGWSKTNPWVLAPSSSENQTTTLSRHYGRRKYNMNFSYVSDTDLFLSNMHSGHGATIDGSDLYSQFYHKNLGSHLPFLFTIDGSTADANGDYGLFRLADGGLKSTQTANRFWNTSLNLVEHW